MPCLELNLGLGFEFGRYHVRRVVQSVQVPSARISKINPKHGYIDKGLSWVLGSLHALYCTSMTLCVV
jgi:hypothetical protein